MSKLQMKKALGFSAMSDADLDKMIKARARRATSCGSGGCHAAPAA